MTDATNNIEYKQGKWHHRRRFHTERLRRMLAMIALLIAYFQPGFANAIGAYDCEHKRAKFVELSLLEPEQCEEQQHEYGNSIEWEVQVLHIDANLRIPAYVCKYVMTKEVTRCGYDSINYGSEYSLYTVPVQLRGTR